VFIFKRFWRQTDKQRRMKAPSYYVKHELNDLSATM